MKDRLDYSNFIREILIRTPDSVLDLGGGTGDLVKFLEEDGVSAVCMDKSEKWWNNRVTDSFILHDITDTPWSFIDNQFDLCTGFGVLKYIPEEKHELLFREIARVTQRGFFGVGNGVKVSPLKVEILKPVEWWLTRFTEIIPSYPVEVVPMRYSIIGRDAFMNRSPVKEYWRSK